MDNPEIIPDGEISFQRCLVCALMGADIPVPGKKGLVCCEVCLSKAANSDVSLDAVPMSLPVRNNLLCVIYRCSQLDPIHIVDAVLWVAMEGRKEASTRVAQLHAAMVGINRDRGSPYCRMPLPLDPTLYNIHATYARHYAMMALKGIDDVTGEKEEDILAGIRRARTVGGESEARAHALCLWLTYVAFWRHYLHDYDWETYCALSESGRAPVSHCRPHKPSVPTTRNLLTADTYASLKRLHVAVSSAVNLLFHQAKLSKDMIKAYLIDGLFTNVSPETFQIRLVDEPGSELEEDAVVKAPDAKRLLEMAERELSSTVQDTKTGIDIANRMTLNEEQFVSSVAETHASILSWARARLDRAVNRVKGFTSRTGYDVVTLADRLYQLAVANKCSDGAIARASGLVIALLNAKAYQAQSVPADQLFADKYADAFQRRALGMDLAQWKKDYDEAVSAHMSLARKEEDRDERINSYTCFHSKAVALPPLRWQQLPADIAAQIVAMGRYMYMTDQSSGVKSEERKKRVKDDIGFLVKELSRKVGSTDMATLLKAISPPLNVPSAK